MTCAPKSANCSRRAHSGAAGNRSHLSRGLNKKARATSRGSADDQSRKFLRTRPQGQVWDAVQDMFVSSRQRFVGLAYTILRNQEDAEDAVQNAMLSAYLHLRNFEGRSALSTWLTRIVLNAALMILRKRKHQWSAPLPESNFEDEVSWPERLPDSKPDPETAYAEKETFKMLDALLGRMKPVHRQAFTLTHYHDMSSVAAAALLDVSTGTFKARLFRARKHLRNKVQRSLAAPLRRTTHSQFSLGNVDLQALSPGPADISSMDVAFS